MIHPMMMSENGKLRHNELLKEAQAERLYQSLKGNTPSLWQRMLTGLGAVLINSGQKLKGQSQTGSTASA